MKPGPKRTTPRGIAQVKRDDECMQLRLLGATYAEIARAQGLKDPSRAREAVVRAVERHGTDSAHDMREIMDRQIDLLLRSAMEKAVREKSLWAIDRALSLLDRRSKLYGLDAPRKVEVGVWTEDAVEREIRALKADLEALPVAERPAMEVPADWQPSPEWLRENGREPS